MKFLCDQMLGTLAKWLRLFGFDVFYTNNRLSDDELLQISTKEKRVIISRDKELILRGEKRKLTTILMETTTPALEIPMELADKWDDMLMQKGRSATYWDIACWAYEQGKKHSKEVLR